MHDDAIHALALHERLGDAEFVDAIAQRRHVLLDGEILPIADLLIAHPDHQRLAVRTVGNDQLRVGLVDDLARLVGVARVTDPDDDPVAVAVDAMDDPVVAQTAVDVLFVGIHALADCRVHVDFQQHVDAAAQVEAERHGTEPQRAHPAGQVRRERERDVGLFLEAPSQQVGRGLLIGFRGEANHRPAVFDERGIRGDPAVFDGLDVFLELGFVDRIAGDGGELHRRQAAIDVRQCKQTGRQHGDQHEHVEPGRILVHDRHARYVRSFRRFVFIARNSDAVRRSRRCLSARPVRRWTSVS